MCTCSAVLLCMEAISFGILPRIPWEQTDPNRVNAWNNLSLGYYGVSFSSRNIL